MTYTIYIDILFLINLLMDYVILWCTGKFLHLPISNKRLLLASIIGGGYGACLVFAELSFIYIIPIKVLFPCLLLYIAFGKHQLKVLAKLTLYFYLISFAMSGAVMGLSSMLAASPWGSNQRISGIMLIGGLVVAIILARYSWQYLSKIWQRQSMIVPCSLEINQRSLEIKVFLDTGNELIEPVSGNQVMIVEYQAIKNILPIELNNNIADLTEAGRDFDPIQVFSQMDTAENLPLSLIPYRGIGKKQGMLLGYKPEQSIFYNPANQEKIICNNLILGIYQNNIGGLKGYVGIVNPSILSSPLDINDQHKLQKCG